jgi:transcriptional regulator with XRE-family HTH domain
MSSQNDLAARIRVARALKGWKQRDLSRKARMDPSAPSRYEKEGGDTAPRGVAERIHAVTEVSPAFTEVVVSSYRVLEGGGNRPAGSASEMEDLLSAEVANRFAALLAPALAVLPIPVDRPEEVERPPAAEDRDEAEALFLRLVPRSVDERLVVVATGRLYRSAALCERLCDESVNAAAPALTLWTHRPGLASLVPWREYAMHRPADVSILGAVAIRSKMTWTLARGTTPARIPSSSGGPTCPARLTM